MISNILILFTKIGILKWKKRIFIEHLFFDSDEKYIASFFNRHFKLFKTLLIFPESCNLNIYNSNNDSYFEFCGVSKLFDYLEKQNCKMWIPDRVLENDSLWCKDNKTKRIVRKYKLQELNDNIRKSQRWFTRYKKIYIN